MKWLVRTLTLFWSLALTVADDTVTCLFSKECVLPCLSSYQDVIHWQKVDSKETVHVHSFYKGADQLEHLNKAYKGRTSLFPDELSKGNISLILRDLRIQDGGRYKCYTSIPTANRETFVIVSVKAPIKSVDIKKTEDGITCNTSEVYPKPKISWSIEGASNDKIIQDTSEEDSQGLFSLTSTLQTQPDPNNPKYTCTVRFEDGSQSYSARLRQEEITTDSGQDVTIHCTGSQGENFILTLAFNGSTILSCDSQTSWPFSTKWKGTDISITREGIITLHKLDHEKHVGTFTCERSTAQSRESMQTSVQIKPGPSLGTILVILGVIIAGIGIIAVIVFIVKRMKEKQKTRKTQSQDSEEMKNLKSNGKKECSNDANNSS